MAQQVFTWQEPRGNEVLWAMKIESRQGTAGKVIRQGEVCKHPGIVWQELGENSANNDDELIQAITQI